MGGTATQGPTPSSRKDLPELSPREEGQGGGSLLSLGGLRELPLQAEILLGTVRMRLGEWLDLRVGSTLKLDRLTGEPLDVIVNGTPVAKGEVRVHGERFAIRITKILPGAPSDAEEAPDAAPHHS